MTPKQFMFSLMVVIIVTLVFLLYIQPRTLDFPERETVIVERKIPDPTFSRPPAPEPTILVDPQATIEPQEIEEFEPRELARKTDENVTVIIRDVEYEIRGDDFVVVNRIDFEVINHADNGIDIVGLLYAWDENDPFDHRALVRTRIPLNTYYGILGPDQVISRNAGIYIPLNDIGEQKTLKLTIIESITTAPKAFVSAELNFNVTDQ